MRYYILFKYGNNYQFVTEEKSRQVFSTHQEASTWAKANLEKGEIYEIIGIKENKIIDDNYDERIEIEKKLNVYSPHIRDIKWEVDESDSVFGEYFVRSICEELKIIANQSDDIVAIDLANALLISKAPEMYNLLVDLVSLGDECGADEKVDELKKKAFALLARKN